VRFVIFGAGAIGGVVGARLFQHDHEVVLIARGAHHDAIAQHGLVLESPAERVTLPIAVVASPSELARRDDDIVMLAMKSQDTTAALDVLRQASDAEPPIVCLQNGVANERAALRRFRDVYAVCVMCPAAHLDPGVVQASSAPISGLLDIGSYPAGLDGTAEQIASALRASTFESEPRTDVMRWKYTKLLMNLANAVEAVCGRADGADELIRSLRREGAACLRAAGIDFASQEEDRARRGNLLTIAPIDGSTRGGGSSWQSLERSTGSIESDYLNGEIVLLGRLHGVPTPANTLMQQLANRAAREHLRPGSVPAREVLAQL
jgi:2-dehydropantoate 2-reductase